MAHSVRDLPGHTRLNLPVLACMHLRWTGIWILQMWLSSCGHHGESIIIPACMHLEEQLSYNLWQSFSGGACILLTYWEACPDTAQVAAASSVALFAMWVWKTCSPFSLLSNNLAECSWSHSCLVRVRRPLKTDGRDLKTRHLPN